MREQPENSASTLEVDSDSPLSGVIPQPDNLLYRCVFSQDDHFWGSIRPNCVYGLVLDGIFKESVRCAKCAKYRAGVRVYEKPFNMIAHAWGR